MLDIPIIKTAKDMVGAGIHKIGEILDPALLVQKLLPLAVEQVVTRVTGSATLAKVASEEVSSVFQRK